MSRLPSAILEALGLAPETDIEPVASVPAPAGSVGMGRGQSAASLDDVLAASPAHLALQLRRAEDYGIRLQRLAREPSIILVDAPDKSATMFGCASRQDAGMYALDTRQTYASLAFQVSGQDVVLHAEQGGGVLLYEFVRFEDPALQRLAAPISSASQELPSVDVPSMLAGESSEPWLESLVRALASSPSLLSRANAVGVLARLFVPRGDLGPELNRALEGSGVSRRALDWATRLSPGLRERIERLAVMEADDLSETLGSVSESISRAPEDARVLVRDWVLRRDDLESVAFLLDRSGSAPELRATLEALDAQASTHLTALSSVSLGRDDRLAAVSWQEPESWWGAFGLVG